MYMSFNDTKILLYADDTSIIVTSPNVDMLQEKSDKIFQDVNNWFKLSQLSLNYKKHNTYSSKHRIVKTIK